MAKSNKTKKKKYVVDTRGYSTSTTSSCTVVATATPTTIAASLLSSSSNAPAPLVESVCSTTSTLAVDDDNDDNATTIPVSTTMISGSSNDENGTEATTTGHNRRIVKSINDRSIKNEGSKGNKKTMTPTLVGKQNVSTLDRRKIQNDFGTLASISTQHDILENLLNVLLRVRSQQQKQQQGCTITNNNGTRNSSCSSSATMLPVDNNMNDDGYLDYDQVDTKFIKRIGTILDRFLLEYQFTIDQVKRALSSSLSSDNLINIGSSNKSSTGNTWMDHLETALLDWLCFHLPNNELPSIFSDGNIPCGAPVISVANTKLNVIAPQGSCSTNDIFMSEAITTTKTTAEGVSANVPQQSQRSADVVEIVPNSGSDSTRNDSSDGHTNIAVLEDDDDNDDGATAAAKLWTLTNYGYYDDDDNLDQNTPVADTQNIPETCSRIIPASDVTTNKYAICTSRSSNMNVDPCSSTVDESEVMISLLSSLDKKRQELNELEMDVNNDANNYMRSKHEIKELQKKVKIVRQQYEGLERKVHQQQKQQRQQQQQLTTTALQQHDSLESECQGMVIHDCTNSGKNNMDGTRPIMDDGANEQQHQEEEQVLDDVAVGIASMFDEDVILTTKNVNVSQLQQSCEGEDLDEVEYITIPNDAIPTRWTGKTPTIILEESCRKERSLSKPIFTKFRITGCRLKIRKTSVRKEQQQQRRHDVVNANKDSNNTNITDDRDVVVDVTVLSTKYVDSQQYTSTVALYKLFPDLPLYRLLPPYYKDLWLSWIANIKKEQQEQVTSMYDQRLERIRDVISCIPSKFYKISIQANATTKTNSNNKIAKVDVDAIEQDESKWDDKVSPQLQPELSKNLKNDKKIPNKLKAEFQERQSSVKYQAMFSVRMQLPIYTYRDHILETIKTNAVTIICAETGSGKTTQCSSYILENALLSEQDKDGVVDDVSIICTQPRRVATISVAERVADELAESNVGHIIGYQVRLDTKRSSQTRLMFCTTGVVLRRLIEDPTLNGVTHVVVDECHERQWQIDCLLVSLRRLIQTARPDLKIILMSATLDTSLFSSFFNGAPVINIPGRTYPINTYYLEDVLERTGHIIEENSRCAIPDYSKRVTVSIDVTTRSGEKRRETADYEKSDAISDCYPGYNRITRRSMDRVDETVLNYELIEDILSLLLLQEKPSFPPPPCHLSNDGDNTDNSMTPNGSILIFLQGIGEIRTLADRLSGSRAFGNTEKFDVIPLHSTLSSMDQRRAFRSSPNGIRKIILSTNIAETSVTIPDVVYVIDSGRVREIQRDKRTGTRKLISTWCARANTKQRAGRAGRVRPGVCIKLYSSRTENEVMKRDSEPELRRIPLEEVCLTILASGFAQRCMDFLLQTPEPPSEDSVLSALQTLCDVGAVSLHESLLASTAESRTQNPDLIEVLTPLGQHLAKLPVEARVGKILIFGVFFRCLDSILSIAAFLSATKSPFGVAFNDGQLAKSAHASFAHHDSDFLTMLNVWEAFSQAMVTRTERRLCKDKFLNYSALNEIRDLRMHYVDLLCGLGFLNKESLGYHPGRRVYDDSMIAASKYSTNSNNEDLIHAVICAGLYPNIAYVPNVRPSKNAKNVIVINNKNEKLSIRDSINSRLPALLPSSWMVYVDKMATDHRVTISNTAFVSPITLILFGSNMTIFHAQRIVCIDDWIYFGVSARSAVMYKQIRLLLNEVLTTFFEESDSAQVNDDTNNYVEIIQWIIKLLRQT